MAIEKGADQESLPLLRPAPRAGTRGARGRSRLNARTQRLLSHSVNFTLSFAYRLFNCGFLAGGYVTIATMDFPTIDLVGRNPTASSLYRVHRNVMAPELA